jgi:hypothetical protein
MTGNGKSRLYKVYICEKNVLQLCRLLDLVLGVALHLNRYLFISSYKASETPDYLFSKGWTLRVSEHDAEYRVMAQKRR